MRGNISNTFDIYGNQLTHTDELGHVTTYTYDAANNMTSVSQQLDSSTTVTTSYTYNSLGEPLTVTDPLGNVTTNTYDGPERNSRGGRGLLGAWDQRAVSL